jgi:ligand-binding sensor protein
MKFEIENQCNCGGRFVFSAYGDAEFGSATCSRCGESQFAIDPLSVSITAERLLHRCKAELAHGDYSLAIVIGAMAVESYLTRMFLKLKGIEAYAATFRLPTPEQEASWEMEYPRSGGFLNPARFVSQKLLGTTFDDFVEGNGPAKAIFLRLPNPARLRPAQYFQEELFKLRNLIVHWGYVNSTADEATKCYTIAVAVVSILREMDKATNWVGFAQEIANTARAGVAAERRHLQEMQLSEERTADRSGCPR